MALDFPSNPTNGQVYDNFIYDAAKGTWKSLSSGASPNYLVNPTITDAVIIATANTSATVPLTVNGAASQSANLQEWKNNNGVIRASVNPDGKLFANGGLQTLYIGNNTDTGVAKIDMDASGTLISTNTGSTIGLRVRNTKAGFTSDLQQWQNESGTNLARIDSVGRIIAPNQPAFSAYASASNIAANQIMPYNNAVINRGGHYNTSTYRFTAPVAGIYLFSVYDIGQTSGTSRFSLYRNGVSTEDSLTHQLRGSNGANFTSATSFWTISANAGDYFSVYIYETGSYGTIEYSWFQGFLIG